MADQLVVVHVLSFLCAHVLDLGLGWTWCGGHVHVRFWFFRVSSGRCLPLSCGMGFLDLVLGLGRDGDVRLCAFHCLPDFGHQLLAAVLLWHLRRRTCAMHCACWSIYSYRLRPLAADALMGDILENRVTLMCLVWSD